MKQSEITRRLHETYAKIDGEREPVCSGCGRWQGGEIKLSHSHIISRANCKGIGKPELIFDENNIVFHCMDYGEHTGCHRRWENGDKRLLDYDKNLEFVRKHSELLYQKLIR